MPVNRFFFFRREKKTVSVLHFCAVGHRHLGFGSRLPLPASITPEYLALSHP